VERDRGREQDLSQFRSLRFQNRYGDQAAAFVAAKTAPAASSSSAPLPPSSKVISKPNGSIATKPAAKPAPPTPTGQKATTNTTPAVSKKAEQKKEAAKAPAKPAAAVPPPAAPVLVDDDEALRRALELSRLEYEQEEKERREAEKKAKRALKIAQKKSAAMAAGTPAPAPTAKPAPVASTPVGDTDGGSRGQAQPSRSLWVGNLSLSVTEEMLRREFASYGPIESIKLLSAKNPTCAFIDFYDQQNATNAKSGLFGKHIQGREMHIYYSMRLPGPTLSRKA
jgi:hypothetical protein